MIEKSILGFNLLEEFYFTLCQEDFDTRWDVIAWPSRLVEEIEQAEETLDKDDEHFRKNLSTDQNKLEDKLDELDSEINNFSSYQDISKAQDTAVRVITNQILSVVSTHMFICKLFRCDELKSPSKSAKRILSCSRAERDCSAYKSHSTTNSRGCLRSSSLIRTYGQLQLSGVTTMTSG